MLRRKKLFFLLTGVFLVIILLATIPISYTNSYDNSNQNNIESPRISADLDDLDEVLITNIERECVLSGYGLFHIEDSIEIENQNGDSLESIYIGIPIDYSEDLIYFEAMGRDDTSLLAEYDNTIMEDCELIEIYFDSPLKSEDSETITFVQTYKDMLDYELQEEEDEEEADQIIEFESYVFPLLPYTIDGDLTAKYEIPKTSEIINYSEWGDLEDDDEIIVEYDDPVDPFLENLGGNKTINITFSDNKVTKMEFIEITREIFVSPWGIIKVKENFLVKNKGEIDIDEIEFEIPGPAKEVTVFDDLGEILGITLDPEVNYTKEEYKDLTIDLTENRVKITPDSKFRFNVQYFLPFEKNISINWFQETIKLDALSTTNEFLGRDQTIKLIIEGCYSLDSVNDSPDAIDQTQTSTILIYESDYVSPLESKEIEVTFTVNFFGLFFRPIIFILIVALISVAYILIIKSRKIELPVAVIRRELIPIEELRQFISLYEEKNALILEIRDAEELTKRKKMAKKKYKNLLNKNTAKIQEIDKEIVPFKKIVLETSVTFENILNKLDLLEAERISVRDSVNLLETRYKRGRLPSKAAYLRLTDTFMKRRKKIDRSIDKQIQSLRSYLL